jgi:hypothetical protein
MCFRNGTRKVEKPFNYIAEVSRGHSRPFMAEGLNEKKDK